MKQSLSRIQRKRIIIALISIVVVLAMAGVIAFSYFGANRNNNQTNNTESLEINGMQTSNISMPIPTSNAQLNATLTIDPPLPETTPTQNSNSVTVPQANPPIESNTNIRERLSKLMNAQQYSSISALLSDRVALEIPGTDCCGTLSKNEADVQLFSLTGETEGWNFDQNNAFIASIKSLDKSKYESLYFGFAPSKYTVGFDFDNNNKINRVVLIPDPESLKIFMESSKNS